MRITQIARCINLVRLNGPEKFAGDAQVVRAQWILSNTARLIERQVKKVNVLRAHATPSCAGTRLATADQCFHTLQFHSVHFARLLGGNKCFDVGFKAFRELATELRKCSGELTQEIQMPQCAVVPHGNAAGGLVRHMYFMTLVAQSDECSAHGDDVVIRVRTEYHHAFGECGIGIIRLSARPTSDGSLQRAKHFDVDVVRIAAAGQERLQTVFVVILFN